MAEERIPYITCRCGKTFGLDRFKCPICFEPFLPNIVDIFLGKALTAGLQANLRVQVEESLKQVKEERTSLKHAKEELEALRSENIVVTTLLRLEKTKVFGDLEAREATLKVEVEELEKSKARLEKSIVTLYNDVADLEGKRTRLKHELDQLALNENKLRLDISALVNERKVYDAVPDGLAEDAVDHFETFVWTARKSLHFKTASIRLPRAIVEHLAITEEGKPVLVAIRLLKEGEEKEYLISP